MENMNQFSVNRLFGLIKREVFLNNQTRLIGIAAGAGFIIFISLLFTYIGKGQFNIQSYKILGHILIFTGGFLITSLTFNDLNKPTRSPLYLLLPASAAEKLLAHWIVTSFGYIIVTYIVLSITLLIAWALNSILWDISFVYFNPFLRANLEIMGIYIVLQSIYFLGALYFKKNNFLKTILALWVIGMIYNIIIIILAVIIFGTGSASFSGGPEVRMENFFIEHFPLLTQVFGFFILTPFMLLVSYFRLKEREA